ncbi:MULTISPECIES: hypothetical protein [unclassified Streptomyces]|uniref:hypothetical protein n=1 Tax=unclassified Streptomyces TaxID=2593676 RepID=UPI002030B81A|nr:MULTISPECIES: hypothetical protein [unclassified Streptomyces]MCM1974548.1 hypothetical protein [Streptomyces sp. G1]MCX5129887.1 hypothetical protein [Streptomyces sp. NBC_00347]MCX5300432.1 hypothetical protein [Streptomyces sp. NBC_00193]
MNQGDGRRAQLRGPAGGWLECVDMIAADGFRQTMWLWGDKGCFATVVVTDPDLLDRSDSCINWFGFSALLPVVGSLPGSAKLLLPAQYLHGVAAQ